MCQGPGGNVTQYQISFQSSNNTENVNIARCTAGRCSYTFEPPSNPPSSYDSVSVAAENVVGVGAARTCTSQAISELGNKGGFLCTRCSIHPTCKYAIARCCLPSLLVCCYVVGTLHYDIMHYILLVTCILKVQVTLFA